MNYRHAFHAGNFADVFKHALLVHLIRALQRKAAGFLYLDTHAGRGRYDLAAAARGDTLARRPEWPDGIGRLWKLPAPPPALADYIGLVREFNRQNGDVPPAPQFYPGSPRLAQLLARPQDRLAFCEKHPEECAALRAEFSGVRRVSVQAVDGYTALRAMLPPPERRALVLIDPAFEAQDEFALITAALGEGLQRLPAGIFALWYPLTERARTDELFAGLTASRLPPTLVLELAVGGEASGLKMRGSGLVILNPPWQFDRLTEGFLPQLAEALAQAPGAGATARWLVPE
ncbi:MAG TPA: 23S rRNA (adenine(2030)-N(6))-methyltransferase RlmJ [Opitutaceae bacterium]|nr:23S rRNA (adenine(2030)-N(6))-methyltransferase RlmJ [Opitutaceae bacterium]